VILSAFISANPAASAQQTCCWRIVKTSPIAVPPEFSSSIPTQTWDKIFSSREFGGGLLLSDCPLAIDIGGPKGFIDYLFRGSITGGGGSGQFVLKMQLVDNHRGNILKEGQISWTCTDEITCAKSLQDNIKTLAMTFQPLDDIIHDYERMPETCEIKPEKDPVEADEEISIQLSKIFDGKGNNSQPWQRLLVKAEKGKILNGKARDNYRVFDVNGGSINLRYKAPEECKKTEETIFVYNSCDIDPGQIGNPEREISRHNFDIVCNQWEGTIKLHWIAHLPKDSALRKEFSTVSFEASKDWALKVTMTRKSAKAQKQVYEVKSANLSFQQKFQFQGTKTEDGTFTQIKQEILHKLNNQELSDGECDLELVIDLDKRAFRMEGLIEVDDVAETGFTSLTVKDKDGFVFNKKEPIDNTSDIIERADFEGVFEGPDKVELKGNQEEEFPFSLPGPAMMALDTWFDKIKGEIEWKLIKVSKE
jgi:hypothetical protein